MAGAKIDFRRVADAALASIESLLASWLPHGRREGHEYKALNPTRGDSREGSFSINLNSGVWADFATDDKGGDLVSLYAYLQGIQQGEAAKALAEQLGITPPRGHGSEVAQLPSGDHAAIATEGGAPVERRRTDWVAVLPVPGDAPPPPVAHLRRGRPEGRWEYRDQAGRLLGIINRFRTSDGGKEVLPLVFAHNELTQQRDWRWLAFPEPRPLYRLDLLQPELHPTVLIVEGEKCADAAAAKLADKFDIVTWPGGSKAVEKADWSPLTGRKVIIWPDCDAQLDKAGVLLPEAAQPGVKAAQRIAQLLTARACKVRLVKIPAPGAKPSGWDIADAIADGWSSEVLYAFIRDNLREAGPSVAEIHAELAGAHQAAPGTERDWREWLVRNGKGELLCNATNAFTMLANRAEWKDVLGYDEFAERPLKLCIPPYDRGREGEWDGNDDSFTAYWLATRAGLPALSSAAAAEAVEMAAREHRFNPVTDYLDGVTWHGTERLDHWMIDYLGVPDTPYARLVGKLWFLGMVARAYEPGCKFDYMPILEGPQGRGKTSALEIIGGLWFGNTDFDMRDKDSMGVLQGKLVYEVAELDSFNKADTTKIKSFVSRTVDEFRPAYARRIVRYPRRVVLVGTTNQFEYFKDQTGNRRFWPIKCVDAMDLDGLRAQRDQLFAEAVHRYRAEERRFPTREEQETLIGPEQERREVGEAWEDLVAHYLNHTDALGVLPDQRHLHEYDGVSAADVLVYGLKIDPGKITKEMSTRLGIVMRRLGWAKVERWGKQPRFVYKRPEKPAEDTSAAQPEIDDVPF